MIPVVADEAEDLLQFKVLLLTLHSQVVQGQMDHIHPDKRRTERIEVVPGSTCLAVFPH